MINPEILLDTIIDNRYRLTRELGKGSFGWVFEATEEMAGQYLGRVAVKLLAPSDEFQREMVFREIRALAGLNHEHIIAYRTSGQIPDGPVAGAIFLVTELGEASLTNFIPPNERLDHDEIGALAQGIALALAYIHAKGSVHRDVKPENIFRVDGKWKLGDFGLVRAVEGAQMSGSGAKGTLRYMAPEVLNNEITAAADVYALSVTLLRALTGWYAHEGEGEGQFIANLMTKPPELPFDLTERWQTILTGCLERNVKERWTAAQLAQYLGSTAAASAVVDMPSAREPLSDTTRVLRSPGSSPMDPTVHIGDRTKEKSGGPPTEKDNEDVVAGNGSQKENAHAEPPTPTTARQGSASDQQTIRIKPANGQDHSSIRQDTTEEAQLSELPSAISCPNCRFVQQGGEECRRCGFLFRSYKGISVITQHNPHSEAPTPSPTSRVPTVSPRSGHPLKQTQPRTDKGSRRLGRSSKHPRLRTEGAQLSDFIPQDSPRSSGRLRYMVHFLSWFWLATTLVGGYFILQQLPPISIQTDPDALTRISWKMRAFDLAARQNKPYTLIMDEAELNAWLQESLRLVSSDFARKAAANVRADDIPAADPKLHAAGSGMKDIRVNLIGENLRAYLLFDIYGQNISLLLEGPLEVEKGYLHLDAVSGQLGSLPLPRITLDRLMRRLWEAPENRANFKLSPNIRAINVQQGRLYIAYDPVTRT